jgi:hypothetical protein
MLVVDGNNVPSPFRPWHRPRWSAAQRLVSDLARLTRAWSSCVDLLFDGRARPGLPNGHVIEGIRVRYAWPGVADDHVVQLLEELNDDGEPSVVATSDGGLGRRARALGAAVVSSECLRHALDRVSGAAHLGIPLRSPLLESPDALIGLQRAMDHRSRSP